MEDTLAPVLRLGRRRPSGPAVFAHVARLGERSHRRGATVGAALAVLVHLGVAATAWTTAASAQTHAPTLELVEIDLAADASRSSSPAPDSMPPAGEPASPQAATERSPSPASAPRPAADPYAGAPMRAAAVVTQSSDAPAAAGDSIASGDGSRSASGAVASNAVGTEPSRSVRAAPPASPPPPPAAPAPREDKSRAAALAGGASWNCPFPPEANAESRDTAVVSIAVTVDEVGSPTSVTVLSDPGHGFARAAKACAYGRSYVAALDATGRPRKATTAPIRVRFRR